MTEEVNIEDIGGIEDLDAFGPAQVGAQVRPASTPKPKPPAPSFEPPPAIADPLAGEPIMVLTGEDGRPVAAVFPSKHADRRWHVVIRLYDGVLTCTCPAAVFNRDRGGCWAMRTGAARLGGTLPSAGESHD